MLHFRPMHVGCLALTSYMSFPLRSSKRNCPPLCLVARVCTACVRSSMSLLPFWLHDTDMQTLEVSDVVAFPRGLSMQLTLSEQGRTRCRRELEGSVGNAGVLAPGCLNPQQAELPHGHRHGQLHLMCGSYLAPCGCSFPLIFGGIDL